ncbi:MAG: hypothetical protein ACR2RF_28265 [Geminicoccaceae bacterium]
MYDAYRVVMIQAMTTSKQASLFAGHRFPAEIITHVVWLCFRFPIGLWMGDAMPAASGIVISHETVRQPSLLMAAMADGSIDGCLMIFGDLP